MSTQANLTNEEIFEAMNSGKKMLFFTAGWCLIVPSSSPQCRTS